jgi:hypothetical protein
MEWLPPESWLLLATIRPPARVVELLLGCAFLFIFCAINGSFFKKAIFAALFAPLCLILLTLVADVWHRLPP